jgi:flagellar biosynthesis protein FlhB
MAERTEAPTPRKRDEARSKGQGVGRSVEFSMGLTLGVGTLALSTLLPGIAHSLVSRTQATVVSLNPRATNGEIIGAAGDAILTMLVLVLPLAVLIMIAGIAGNLVSGGLVFSPKAIRFDLSRINPIAGFKRLADRQALVRLGIASAKLAILGFISWQVVGSRVPIIVNSQGSTAPQIAGTCLSAIFQLGLTITILLAVVALVDFVVQRRRAMESIRMTKDEVKQEYKESEGDPQIRGARRRRARQMAFARMMDAVPTADVVVTNPTTLAVALKYDSLTMRAPRIVAKGQRLMAERIKELARDHKVPIVEDKPLARALFSRPIGSEVPAHLYRAVARLLVLVHQARFTRAATRSDGGRDGRTWTADRARGAAGGLASRPWWTTGRRAPAPFEAGAAIGGEVIGRPNDLEGAMAARLYGGNAADASDEDEAEMAAGEAGDEDESWLGDVDGGADEVAGGVADEGAQLTLADVDEAALAAAMAEDELKDLTTEEIAAYEAEMALGPEADLGDKAGTDEDPTSHDEERAR